MDTNIQQANLSKSSLDQDQKNYDNLMSYGQVIKIIGIVLTVLFSIPIFILIYLMIRILFDADPYHDLYYMGITKEPVSIMLGIFLILCIASSSLIYLGHKIGSATLPPQALRRNIIIVVAISSILLPIFLPFSLINIIIGLVGITKWLPSYRKIYIAKETNNPQ